MKISYFLTSLKQAIKDILYRTIHNPEQNMETRDRFHYLFYNSRVWNNTKWLGARAKKNPLDLWVYQEILNERKPDLVIETGTADGGSTLFIANVMDLIGKGNVISIDIAKKQRPVHHRITYMTGSSISDDIIMNVKTHLDNNTKVMVILDSDHNKAHVLKELEIYCEFVMPGDYLIVEDTNVNGHPVFQKFGPGPMEAVEEFLEKRNDFSIDRSREKFLLTFNPYGFLKKTK